MFKNAKLNDEVWSINWGLGKIVNIFENTNYPLVVKFNTDKSLYYTFTLDGKYNINDINPTLFWNKINFEIPEKLESNFWEPKDGEESYYVNHDGTIFDSKYWDINNTPDRRIIEQGNVFKTTTEAEKEVELRKAKYRVKKRIWELNGGEFIEFEFGNYNWSFDLGVECIISDGWYNKKTYPNWQYLKSNELVKQLIEELYEDLQLIRGE